MLMLGLYGFKAHVIDQMIVYTFLQFADRLHVELGRRLAENNDSWPWPVKLPSAIIRLDQESGRLSWMYSWVALASDRSDRRFNLTVRLEFVPWRWDTHGSAARQATDGSCPLSNPVSPSAKRSRQTRAKQTAGKDGATFHVSSPEKDDTKSGSRNSASVQNSSITLTFEEENPPPKRIIITMSANKSNHEIFELLPGLLPWLSVLLRSL